MILTNIQEQILEDLTDRFQVYANNEAILDDEQHSMFHFEMAELAECIGIHVNELWNILFEKIDFEIRYRIGD
tara:strand:- start:158 stop:376 length:219 start_codon:yes stop_codon:yes gene_type:complete